MRFWKKLRLLIPSVRRAADRDMRDELDALESIAGRGQLGNITLAAEDARAEMTWLSLERLGQDLRYGFRSLRRDKLFALLAVASLVLGIGTNTAIYSFMDSVLLRPLPVADPQSLVIMKWQARGYTLAHTISWSTGGSSFDQTGVLSSSFPYPALRVFQAHDDVLANTFCYFENHELSVTVSDNTDSLLGQYVSGQYFQGMGAAPAAGRLIQPSDDDPAPAPVAVVSSRFATGHFGGARAAVGHTIRVEDQQAVVIGVTPAGFFGAEPGAVPDVYLPLHAALSREVYEDDHYYWIEMMGRLAPGVTLEQAQARLAPAFHQFVADSATTEQEKQDLPQLRLQEGATGLDSLRREYARPIYVLTAMVGLILLIACANIANLLLARGTARRREIAIRLSVGASRWRVIRQLLTESILLSGIGGALGVALAWWGIRVLTALLANGRENFTLHAGLNGSLLIVTLVLSVLTGLLFGVAPAFQATRVDVAPALKDAGARDTPRPSRGLGLGWALVVAQMALSLLLLVGAGLFDRTVASLHDIPLGFNREHVLLFTIQPFSVGYDGPSGMRLFENLRERLHELPGVRDVGLSTAPLPTGGGTSAPVQVIGAVPAAPPHVVIGAVGPDFFKTMQIPIVAGREYTARDNMSAPPLVIVNRRFADVFRLANPVGRIATLGKQQYQIIGLAENALTFSLKGDTRPAVYFSYLQSANPAGSRAWPRRMTYEIRTSGDPRELAAPVRALVRETDSRLAIHDMKTQAEHIDQTISTEITLAKLCSAFASLAVVIACVGLYGTVAFNVARRTTEIGIRSALGASAGRIVWMILRDVCLMAAAGLAIGVPVVLAGSRYVKSFLFGVAPNDPAAIAVSVALLVTAGLVAAYAPARRASRTDPLRAIRCE
jgi:predicted permease